MKKRAQSHALRKKPHTPRDAGDVRERLATIATAEHQLRQMLEELITLRRELEDEGECEKERQAMEILVEDHPLVRRIRQHDAKHARPKRGGRSRKPSRLEAARNLRDAALTLAGRYGEEREICGMAVTEILLAGLTAWVTRWRPDVAGLEIWDEGAGGKVLNVAWAASGELEVRSFRRGEWENLLLERMRQSLN